MSYIFVAYKPDSSDYCRGCHMASYSSGFVSRSNLNEEELVEVWGEIKIFNDGLDNNEEGYGVQIWKDGVLVWDEIEFTCEKPDYMYELSEAAYNKGANILAEKKRKAREAFEAKKIEDEKIAKEIRRKQYEALKKEFKE